jgi:hypothetical protein
VAIIFIFFGGVKKQRSARGTENKTSQNKTKTKTKQIKTIYFLFGKKKYIQN